MATVLVLLNALLKNHGMFHSKKTTINHFCVQINMAYDEIWANTSIEFLPYIKLHNCNNCFVIVLCTVPYVLRVFIIYGQGNSGTHLIDKLTTPIT